MQLFQKSWDTHAQEMTARAVAQANRLDGTALSDPSSAGALKKIIDTHRLNVAEIDKAKITRKAKMVGRREPDYGGVKTVNYPVLVYTIPFTGDPHSLQVAPTVARHMVQDECKVVGHKIEFTTDDNDKSDDRMETFLAEVMNNLDALRKEAAAHYKGLKETLGSVIDQRRAHLKDQLDRDAKSKYPTTRS